MAQANKKRVDKLSAFARSMAKANALLDVEEAGLSAARLRAETLFAQPNMDADAIRRRVNSDWNQDNDRPFTVMAGARS